MGAVFGQDDGSWELAEDTYGQMVNLLQALIKGKGKGKSNGIFGGSG